eukprot:7383293-Prymnesium_polylepis.1
MTRSPQSRGTRYWQCHARSTPAAARRFSIRKALASDLAVLPTGSVSSALSSRERLRPAVRGAWGDFAGGVLRSTMGTTRSAPPPPPPPPPPAVAVVTVALSAHGDARTATVSLAEG